jgi:hypothetical protein
MEVAKFFPTVVWLFRIFTGRPARRIYLALFLLLLCVPTVPRIRNAYRAWKFRKVLAGLERVKVDQTTEAELVKLVPYLSRRPSYKLADRTVETWYAVEFSNESNRSAEWLNRFLLNTEPEHYEQSMKRGRLLGTWFLSFGAGVIVRNGTVAWVDYGINAWGGWPRALGQTLSVESVHGPWLPYRRGFEISSIDDQNLRFRVSTALGSNDEMPGDSMDVKWTPDAPPELMSHIYRIDLSCAWSLRGCISAREIAPMLWQDMETARSSAYARLTGHLPCPDSILADRVRHLPDLDVLLLEAIDPQQGDVNVKGEVSHGDYINYKLIDVVRGPNTYPSKMRLRWRQNAMSLSEEPSRELGTVPFGLRNPLPPYPRPGDRLLFFTNLTFESCQLVPATPSALSAVRNTPGAPRLPEDEIPMGLQ